MGQRKGTDAVGGGFLQVIGTWSTEKLGVPELSPGSGKLTRECSRHGNDMPTVEKGSGLNCEKLI